jgi:hypothetical protein
MPFWVHIPPPPRPPLWVRVLRTLIPRFRWTGCVRPPTVHHDSCRGPYRARPNEARHPTVLEAAEVTPGLIICQCCYSLAGVAETRRYLFPYAWEPTGTEDEGACSACGRRPSR